MQWIHRMRSEIWAGQECKWSCGKEVNEAGNLPYFSTSWHRIPQPNVPILFRLLKFLSHPYVQRQTCACGGVLAQEKVFEDEEDEEHEVSYCGIYKKTKKSYYKRWKCLFSSYGVRATANRIYMRKGSVGWNLMVVTTNSIQRYQKPETTKWLHTSMVRAFDRQSKITFQSYRKRSSFHEISKITGTFWKIRIINVNFQIELIKVFNTL